MVSYKSSYKNIFSWGISSVGRAPALQAGGHEFDSRILHLAVKTAENLIRYSSLAQSVEHSAVNRSVVGSSPTGGAHKARKFNVYGFYFIPKLLRNLPDSAIYRVYPVMAWLDRGENRILIFYAIY